MRITIEIDGAGQDGIRVTHALDAAGSTGQTTAATPPATAASATAALQSPINAGAAPGRDAAPGNADNDAEPSAGQRQGARGDAISAGAAPAGA